MCSQRAEGVTSTSPGPAVCAKWASSPGLMEDQPSAAVKCNNRPSSEELTWLVSLSNPAEDILKAELV